MRVLVAVDLDDNDLTDAYGYDLRDRNLGHEWDDIHASIAARLGEAGHFGPTNTPVRGRVVAVGDVTNCLEEFLASAEIGAEGHDDQPIAGHILGTIATMRQSLDA